MWVKAQFLLDFVFLYMVPLGDILCNFKAMLMIFTFAWDTT